MIQGDAPQEIPMPITKAAIPRSAPCGLADAFAMAIAAQGPIPMAAIIKPIIVRVGEPVKMISSVPVVIAKIAKFQMRCRLYEFLVDK